MECPEGDPGQIGNLFYENVVDPLSEKTKQALRAPEGG